MKKTMPFIAVYLLMCAIPFAVYFFSPNHDGEAIGYSSAELKHEGMSMSVEATEGNYHISLTPENIPLKTGWQDFTIDLTRQQTPVSKTPGVKVIMYMGKHVMTAPVQVEKLGNTGQYRVKTDFSMAGMWHMAFTPAPDVKPLDVSFWVGK